MKEFLFAWMAKISGQPYNPAWEGKVFSILTAGAVTSVFLLFFVILFYKYAWRDRQAKWWGIIVAGILFVFIAGKFVLSRLWTGYISEHFLFFSLPSPKVTNPLWIILVVILFGGFLKFRDRFSQLKTKYFLLLLLAFFFFFSTTVAGIREGRASIADPMTRTHWEYTGNIKLIASTYNFLRDYISLQPDLAVHSITHPPGYSLLVYYFSRLIGFSFLGISLLIILAAGLAIFPIYYLLKRFLNEEVTRQVLQVYIFIPGIVLMSGTSLDAFFLTIVWATFALLFAGLDNSWRLAFAAGLAAGMSLLSNFLFLLTAPVFLIIFLYVLAKKNKADRILVYFRLFISLLAFVMFFIVLYQWADYSIIENFVVARGANREVVISNFTSLGTYLLFMAMNILSFSLALGIMNVLIFIKSKKEIFARARPELWLGFAYVLFLLVVGVFQGELARLWMFVVPFFLFPLSVVVQKLSHRQFNVFLSLLFLQIVLIQILFYTYW